MVERGTHEENGWVISLDRRVLDKLYRSLNRPEYIHPDPLEAVVGYTETADREIAALIASSLAYGRVIQIVKTVTSVIETMDRPYRYVMTATPRKIRADFRGFKHRFTTSEEIVEMLLGMKSTLREYGSLEACYSSAIEDDCSDSHGALSHLVLKLKRGGHQKNSLLPEPDFGSACKRLNLFLKWMVREDDVDPGGWSTVDPSKLIVPLDTHMYRIGRALNATERKAADLKTARGVTDSFRRVAPDDPTKYDFALTRLGMRYGADVLDFVERAK